DREHQVLRMGRRRGEVGRGSRSVPGQGGPVPRQGPARRGRLLRRQADDRGHPERRHLQRDHGRSRRPRRRSDDRRGALSATGIGAVVGGPIAAAGAIISGGAALADVGKMVYDNWDSISATAADAWNATTDFVSDTAGAVADTAGDVVDAVSDGFSDAVDGLADALPW